MLYGDLRVEPMEGWVKMIHVVKNGELYQKINRDPIEKNNLSRRALALTVTFK